MSADLRTAAVLVPVFRDSEGELRIVLVVRADDGGQHGGQLGLPGGKPEPGDTDLLATALREAEEEVGLTRGAVEVMGCSVPGYSGYGSTRSKPVSARTRATSNSGTNAAVSPAALSM